MASMFSYRTAKNALSWKRPDNEPGAQPSSLDMAFSVRQPNPDLVIALESIVVPVSAHAGKCRRRSEDWLVHVAEIAELFFLLFLSLFCSSRKLLNTTKLGKESTHSIGARKGAYKRWFRSVFLSLSPFLCLYGGRLSCCFLSVSSLYDGPFSCCFDQ
jgi:hypothetical protein